MLNNMIFNFASLCVVLAVFVFVATGCGPSRKIPDKAQQAKISGKVTLDGTKFVPAETSVVFACPEKNATVSGKVDASGAYTIQAGDKSVGIPAGMYKVMVRPPETPAAQIEDADYEKKMLKGITPPKSDIPEKFHALDSSKISIEIKPGPNTIDLDLSKY